MERFKEVTKAVFFQVIGPLNVHAELLGRYPYTSIFKTQDSARRVVGKIEPIEDRYPYAQKYLIAE